MHKPRFGWEGGGKKGEGSQVREISFLRGAGNLQKRMNAWKRPRKEQGRPGTSKKETGQKDKASRSRHLGSRWKTFKAPNKSTPANVG